MNSRRRLLLVFGAGAACHAALARAQVPSVPLRRVGVLAPSTAAKEEVTLQPFFDEMRRLGWIEGRNIAYERAFADDRQMALPELAAALAASKPDLIYAPPAPAAVAAQRATRTIPIVFGTGTDPVGTGLVASLARPGGNVTGVISVVDSLAPKLVELLGVVLPHARRLGLLGDPTDPRSGVDKAALVPVASARGLTVLSGDASSRADFDAAVSNLLAQRVDAIITGTSLAFNMRSRLLQLTSPARVPVAGHRAELADVGALLSYGASLAGQLRRSARLVDRVLKGARPSELPVEQPTLFELVVNLKTARALGVSVPPSILLRADRVIE